MLQKKIGKIHLVFITAAILLLPHVSYSDIVVTTDGMVLNGKIIEDITNDHIILGNDHGVFRIHYTQIKDMHKTHSYREDVKILKKMGKSVSETDIKTNFKAGIDKLEAKKIEAKKLEAKKLEAKKHEAKKHEAKKLEAKKLEAKKLEAKKLEARKLEAKKLEAKNLESRKLEARMIKAGSIGHLLLVSPFVVANIGKMQSGLPFSFGVSLTGDIQVASRYKYVPGWFRIELQYYHSENGINRISAPRFSLGAVWKYPLETRGISSNLILSPTFGAGHYAVRGKYKGATGFKWNLTITSGLEFFFSSWVFTPHIRFEYIHNGARPIFGIGINIGAGYLFSIKPPANSS